MTPKAMAYNSNSNNSTDSNRNKTKRNLFTMRHEWGPVIAKEVGGRRKLGGRRKEERHG
jgi:hypothetical protein